ncbi:MAG: hypothetical protein ACP5GJ_03175 [Nanopusillaceae archaeon]
MDLISQVLLKIYGTIGKPLLEFIVQSPIYFADFIIFLIFLIIGYIIAKISVFILRIIFGYIKLDRLTEKYPSLFFGKKVSQIILDLTKYYIILYFIIIGIITDFPNLYFLFGILNTIYIALIIVLVGVGIGEGISILFNAKQNARMFIKGLFIYIFLTIALSYVGFNSTILVDTLYYLLISAAIAFGIVAGILIAIEYKDIILKLIK